MGIVKPAGTTVSIIITVLVSAEDLAGLELGRPVTTFWYPVPIDLIGQNVCREALGASIFVTCPYVHVSLCHVSLI